MLVLGNTPDDTLFAAFRGVYALYFVCLGIYLYNSVPIFPNPFIPLLIDIERYDCISVFGGIFFLRYIQFELLVKVFIVANQVGTYGNPQVVLCIEIKKVT